MESTLSHTNELQVLERRLASEIEGATKKISPLHNLAYNHSVNKKIELINWTLDTIESNPSMTLQELEGLIDYRIESSERELDDAQTREETDRIFGEVRILDWVMFMIRTAMQSNKTTDYSLEE